MQYTLLKFVAEWSPQILIYYSSKMKWKILHRSFIFIPRHVTSEFFSFFHGTVFIVDVSVLKYFNKSAGRLKNEVNVNK